MCQKAILVAADTSNLQRVADRYAVIVDRLMLRDPVRRGNGRMQLRWPLWA